MGTLRIIRKSHWKPDEYRNISHCPKDIEVTVGHRFDIEIVMEGKTQFYVDHELEYWLKNFGEISPRLCGIFHKLFGFIPFMTMNKKSLVIWDREKDPTAYPDYQNLDKPTAMVQIMGIDLPKAVVIQMGFIRGAQEELGNIFANLKEFEPKLEEFPKYIREHVQPALLMLISKDQSKCLVEYLFVYEMLGIPLTDSNKYFINGEDLIPLNNKNLIKNGKFYGHDTFSVPPFPEFRNRLSHESVSYITDSMIHVYSLHVGIITSVPPTPFQMRIYQYFMKTYPSPE